MLNPLFVAVVCISMLLAAAAGRMPDLTAAIVDSAKSAVELAIGLVGAMAFFLGLMRVAEKAGLMRDLSRLVAPLLRRLFPDVPPDHPALSAMILNVASNMMGLANAATPFGIRAMEQLDKLNPRRGTATNAMVLFLAINTSGLALLPTSVIALRASLGSHDPAGIFFTTWVASGAATVAGVTAALLLSRLPWYRATAPAGGLAETEVQSGGTDPALPASAEPLQGDVEGPSLAPSPARRWVGLSIGLVGVGLALRHVMVASPGVPFGDVARQMTSFWVLPALVTGLVVWGWVRGVRVYDALVEGGREGFQVALRVIPYLVAILVAVGMFRAAGGIDLLVAWIGGTTSQLGLPAEALPMALLRPISGSGAYGVMAEVMRAHGPDSYIGYLVSTIQGSTETTFYVLAVYFGAIGVQRTRHALPACLIADFVGLSTAVLVVHWVFGDSHLF